MSESEYGEKKWAFVKFYTAEPERKFLGEENLATWGRNEKEYQNYAVNTLDGEGKVPKGTAEAEVEVMTGPEGYGRLVRNKHAELRVKLAMMDSKNG